MLFASCGTSGETAVEESPEVTNLAFVDEEAVQATTSTTLIAAAPDVRLSDADNELVRFESTWICEVQRRTFQTQSGRDEALVEKLEDFGLTEEEYREFRSRVNDDRDLRDSILYSYQETCRP